MSTSYGPRSMLNYDGLQGQTKTSVLNQDICLPCCWAIATADHCTLFKRRKREILDTLELAPRRLMDQCNPETKTVEYYNTPDAFKYVQDAGLPSSDTCPFHNGRRKCKTRVSGPLYFIEGYRQVSISEYEMKVAVLQTGSIVVDMLCDEYFTNIRSDEIYYGPQDPKVFYRHSVVLYGFETCPQTNLSCWLIKNSLGEIWGEGGYGKVIMRSSRPDSRAIIEDAYCCI